MYANMFIKRDETEIQTFMLIQNKGRIVTAIKTISQLKYTKYQL